MRTIFIVLLTLVVSGCATTGHYGSFLPEDKNDIEIRIVHDAVDQLIELYPPAKSRLNLKHEASGQFGVTLVRILRKEGYAVKEYDKTKGEIGESDKDGFSLRYVLDVAGTPDFYRLTLMIGEQSISRPYLRQGTSVVPAGYWARKE